MGIKLVSPGALAPWYTKVIPPVSRGLEGWFCFDTSLDRIGYNRASGKANARLVGVPSVFSTHARFKGGVNFLETAIAETEEFTVLVVGKAAGPLGGTGTATAVPYVGNYAGASPGLAGGLQLYHISDTTLTGQANRLNSTGDGSTSAQSQISDVAANWGIRCLRSSGSGGNQTWNLTTGVKGNQQLTTKRLLASVPLRIGGTYASTFGGESDVSHVAVYSVALTDDEITVVAAAMRKRMARLGVIV
ncbi:hypothetical protein [Pseudomonas cremoricolorata]|uniref:Uncharacterized protein n=1 Tax=Pseudomonas cremoricolorata TaxID=157783 RepID=A0A089YET3_9PSED|nr:hypothetical protein [Pseudomonas cremoricolorata]AIR90238.1 hypothetical protein LK03_13450 [Pseudomonas cremoricolorata]